MQAVNVNNKFSLLVKINQLKRQHPHSGAKLLSKREITNSFCRSGELLYPNFKSSEPQRV